MVETCFICTLPINLSVVIVVFLIVFVVVYFVVVVIRTILYLSVSTVTVISHSIIQLRNEFHFFEVYQSVNRTEQNFYFSHIVVYNI